MHDVMHDVMHYVMHYARHNVVDLVHDARRGDDEVEVILALESLLQGEQ